MKPGPLLKTTVIWLCVIYRCSIDVRCLVEVVCTDTCTNSWYLSFISLWTGWSLCLVRRTRSRQPRSHTAVSNNNKVSKWLPRNRLSTLSLLRDIHHLGASLNYNYSGHLLLQVHLSWARRLPSKVVLISTPFPSWNELIMTQRCQEVLVFDGRCLRSCVLKHTFLIYMPWNEEHKILVMACAPRVSTLEELLYLFGCLPSALIYCVLQLIEMHFQFLCA